MATLVAHSAGPAFADAERLFNRIASMPVFRNTGPATQTVSEIVAASQDGNTLIYTDSAGENVGFVDITDPFAPAPAGTVPVGGEPTSVAVAGPWALVAVDTSEDFVSTSGLLRIIQVSTQAIVRTIALGGQPDSVAVSHNTRHAIIAIENERDEDLGDGEPPQAPAGFVTIIDLAGPVESWTTTDVSLVGIPTLFPDDPEPEYVDINERGIAAVTLQENNHVVLIDVKKKQVVGDFSAGTVNLVDVDVEENGLIEQSGTLVSVPREPDAVKWINPNRLATADEGDLFGGSRGFTIFDTTGNVVFSSASDFEHLAARVGHYPEERSENKGTEPEAVTFGRYSDGRLLFVGSERSSIVGVYKLLGDSPTLLQVLPTGLGPEGLLAIPGRDLFVTASEEDSREDGFRSEVTIYQLQETPVPDYPTIFSADRPSTGLPIPWAALSALAADPADANVLYTAYDSFFADARVFTIDASSHPAVIVDGVVLHDAAGNPLLDLDVEGVATRPGGFWVVSEGAGSVDDPARPVETLNLLLRIAADGEVLETIQLPAETNDLQRRFGFEGVASVAEGGVEVVYVAFQREWVGDPDDRVRIGRYDTSTGSWTFLHYPIDAPTSPNGGWVGLSEIVSLGSGRFAVVERDNQAGADARIKQLATFDVTRLAPAPEGGAFPVVDKTVVRDLLPDLAAPAGAILEKVEGLARAADGDVWIVTDNDGVDDSRGETQLQNLGPVLD